MLRPGTHVLRRLGGQLQVGLDHGTALVLPDREQVRHTLRLLSASADLAEYADQTTVDLLERHGLVVDEGRLMPLLSDDAVSPHTSAAVVRATGPAAPGVIAARRRSRVEVRTFGHPVAAALHDDFRALAHAAGIRRPTGRETATDCGVLLGVGEPDRELVDSWTRAGTPYLLVRLTEGRAVLGPFVAPGQTACVRCVDAHCADADPSWPLLVRQYASAASRDRPDGAPEPLDPLLASLAVAWAARDLASYVDGLRPSTWSSTVTLHGHLSRIEHRSWLRHPACCCTWD